jgi:hypothetical protein
VKRRGGLAPALAGEVAETATVFVYGIMTTVELERPVGVGAELGIVLARDVVDELIGDAIDELADIDEEVDDIVLSDFALAMVMLVVEVLTLEELIVDVLVMALLKIEVLADEVLAIEVLLTSGPLRVVVEVVPCPEASILLIGEPVGGVTALEVNGVDMPDANVVIAAKTPALVFRVTVRVIVLDVSRISMVPLSLLLRVLLRVGLLLPLVGPAVL